MKKKDKITVEELYFLLNLSIKAEKEALTLEDRVKNLQIKGLIDDNMLTSAGASLTEKGKVYVKALQAVKMPKQVWK